MRMTKVSNISSRLIPASINQRVLVAHMHTRTQSCGDMNSSHWMGAIGRLPAWAPCWAGKWWVNRYTPGLCCTPPPNPPHTHTHINTHPRCYCSPLHVFPCFPSSWGPVLPAGTFLPCQISLCWYSLWLCFHCRSFFITRLCLFLSSPLRELSVMGRPPLTHTPPRPNNNVAQWERFQLWPKRSLWCSIRPTF